MANAQFRAVCLVVLLISATFFSALLFLPQFQQKILGYTPLEAGLGLLPFMGMFAVTSFVAGRFYDRLGPKVIVSAGAACMCGGGLLISLVDRSSGIGALVPGMLVLGVGTGLFYSSVTTAAVTALDPSRAGLAGGIVYMFQVAGGSIGLGLTTAVFTTASQDKLQADAIGLSERETEAVDGLLAGTKTAASEAERFTAEAFSISKSWCARRSWPGCSGAFASRPSSPWPAWSCRPSTWEASGLGDPPLRAYLTSKTSEPPKWLAYSAAPVIFIALILS